MSDLHKGHRARVKEEFRQCGLDHFPLHRIMELLLFYSTPLKDTNEIGHELVNRFGSLTGIFDAPYELLCEVDGVKENSATLIKLVSALIKAYMDDYTSLNNTITDPASAKEYMRYKFLCETSECIILACLGNNGKVLFCNKIAKGTPETVSLVPSDVARMLLRANGLKAVIAHNHPNGICNPSSKDLRTTSILYEELRRVDLELIDHIIVAQDGVYSMLESNMFPKTY